MSKLITFVFFITLLPNELIAGNSSYLLAGKFACVAILILYLNLIKKVKHPKSITNIYYFLFLLAIVSIGIIRNNHPVVSFQSNVFRFAYFGAYFYAIMSVYSYYSNKFNAFNQVLFMVVLMPAYLYYSSNLLLWLFNYPPVYAVLVHQSIGSSVFLSFIGVHVQRVQFPLAGGFNDYAAQIAITLAITLALLVNKKVHFKKFYLLIGTGVSILSILLIDSRIAFICASLIVIVLLTLSRKLKNLLALASIICFFSGSFLMSTILPALSKSSLINSVSRTSTDIVSGNSRLTIWGYVNNELSNFKFEHIIGYGEYGHYGSRVSLKWAPLFVDYTDKELKSPHNTIYSIILDYGYIGLLAYFLLYMRVFAILKQKRTAETTIYSVALALLLINGFNGITETIFGFYCQNYIYIFLSVILILILAYSAKMQEQIIVVSITEEAVQEPDTLNTEPSI